MSTQWNFDLKHRQRTDDNWPKHWKIKWILAVGKGRQLTAWGNTIEEAVEELERLIWLQEGRQGLAPQKIGWIRKLLVLNDEITLHSS